LTTDFLQGSAARDLKGGGSFYFRLPLQILSEFNSEKVMKIRPCLPKLL